MHNYNPDNKYKFQTRIGNWSEEWELEETKKKDYLKGKQNAQLSSIIRDQKTNFSLRVASLSISPDQYLHFGHHLMLKNHKTQYYLAIDIQERIQSDSEAYAITTAPMTQPTVRSVFVIIPYEKEPNYYQDDLLHYGQHFRLLANPRISNNKKFYLHSMPISPVRCAKLSRKQEVCATEADVFNTVWKFEFADPKYRFEYDGQPVQLNETVLIKHSFTQHWLASDEIVYQNDFGREREVFVHSYQCLNKTQNLISEKEGRTTIDIPLRNQEPQNLWSIVVAKDKSQSFDESIIDDTKNVKNLVNQIRQQVLSKGYYGVRGLAKIFDGMDVDRSGLVQYDDFKWGLRNFEIKLSEDESKTIFNTFDQNQTGKIDTSEFLSLFRVQPNALRSNIIKKAYEKVLSQGQVTIETLGKLIQVKQHPDVIKGYKTEKQIFQEFVSNWDKAQPNRIISFDEFNFYYLDISSAIEKDETFEAILKKSWNI